MTIVGIGASAGGLTALKKFFSTMPEDSGMAFVVVVHLSPKHESVLAELLQPHIKMPVHQVNRTLELKPNTVYIIPPNANLNSIDTHLRLTELENGPGARSPIDHFFRTLAKTHDGNAIGIILTGTGSDGTIGLKEIKEKGGFVFVQDPNEAEYDGMPLSAISTGLVDRVLPLKDIPAYIHRFISARPRIKSLEPGAEPEPEEYQILQKIYAVIRSRTGRDFSNYKISTIMRRMQRRMQLMSVRTLVEYLEILRKNPDETDALANDFLINVTVFFRDPEVFMHLRNEVIPRLFEGKNRNDRIRVWSVGCATGEEAYSIAILLLEESGRHDSPPQIQIFASDLHEDSLKKAREGSYPADIVVDVTTPRLSRFFTMEKAGYRVNRDLRECVIFTQHNLMADPPFSQIDLLLCRNLVIYLKREVQKDIFELFHYSLRTNGFLVLGASENIESRDLFAVENKALSVYSRRNISRTEPKLPVFPKLLLHGKPLFHPREEPVLSPGELHMKAVERFAPPSILLSPDYQVVHVSENAGKFLSVRGGEPVRDIFQLIRKELQFELRSIIYASREKKEIVRSRPLVLSGGRNKRRLIMSVRNIDDSQLDGTILLMFEEYASLNPADQAPDPVNEKKQETARIKELEEEREEYRRHLQAVIEEYETSKEEMKASNEELQSANEELRSTLEELETSKEELQSINEELTTVNQENRHKVEELSQLSDDLQNLLTSTDIATLFLDREFRILRFTPRLGDLFNVRKEDQGRPISDQTNKVIYDDMIADAEKVLKSLQPIEHEIRNKNGNTFLARVLPYRSGEDKIEGVVITFIDISAQKKMIQELSESKVYAESIFQTLHDPLLVLTPDLKIKSANTAFYDQFHTDERKTSGRFIREMDNGQWNIPDLIDLLNTVQAENTVITNFELKHTFETLGERFVSLNVRQLGEQNLMMVGIRDITEMKQAEQALRRSEERLRRMLNIERVGVLSLNSKGTIIDANDAFLNIIGYSRKEIESGSLSWKSLTPSEYMEISRRQFQQLRKTGRIGPYEKEYLKKDGSRIWMFFVGSSLDDHTVIEYGIDITDRKKAQMAVQISEERFRVIVDLVPDLLWSNDKHGRTDWYNWQLLKYTGLNSDHTSMQRWQEVIHPDDYDQVIRAFNSSFNAGERFRMEMRIRRHDGEYRWFLTQIVPFRNKEGKIIKWYGSATDIHEERVAMEAIRQAKEEAEKAARAKEEFLAHMSHEIRTPLNAIVGISHLLIQEKPRKDQIENLHNLKYSAENLHVLINDILDLSKVQAGKMPVVCDEFSTEEFINKIMNIHQNTAREKELGLEMKIGRNVPHYIITDQLKLSQILNNLISNALKFTAEGKIELEIKFNRQQDDGIWLDFSVRDTGIGISEDKMQRIFDEFSQGDSSTVRKYGGTGLGLTLCRLYLEMLGSSINVESTEGEGSRFFFTLPVKAGDGKTITNAPDKDAKVPDDLQDVHILLVEDAEVNRMVMEQFLKKWWHLSCDEAIDGRQAIELARKKVYQLILMDVRMPVMDGYEATRQIRQLPGYENVKVIALTADVSKQVNQEMEKGLFDDIIIKPIQPEELLRKIEKYAGGAGNPNPVKGNDPGLPEGEWLSLKKVHEFMENDAPAIHMFLHQTVEELEGIKDQYVTAMKNREPEALGDLKHKYKWVFDLLEINEINELLLKSHNMLKENSHDEEQLRQVMDECEGSLSKLKTVLSEKLVKEGI